MCRLFGFRSAVPSRAHRSLHAAENALAEQSRRHPDGWGIGWIVDDDAYVVRSREAAHTCDHFRRASERLSSNTMVVHVRRATVGSVDHHNAHPFRYGRWLFAHNGTIFDFDDMHGWMESQIDEGFRPQVMGDTDSEHLFYFLLSALADNGIDRSGRRAFDGDLAGRVVRRALLAIDEEARWRGHLRPITNVILTNGAFFLAHRAGMPLWLSTQKTSCADEQTCPIADKVCLAAERPEGRAVNHVLVASERIGAENLWEEITDGTTVMVDDAFGLTRMDPPLGWKAPELPEALRAPPLAPEAHQGQHSHSK